MRIDVKTTENVNPSIRGKDISVTGIYSRDDLKDCYLIVWGSNKTIMFPSMIYKAAEADLAYLYTRCVSPVTFTFTNNNV